MLGVHSEEAAMIGDRMDTDMVAGIETGLDTVSSRASPAAMIFPSSPTVRGSFSTAWATSPVRSGHKKQKISGAQAPQQEVVFPMNGMKNIDKSTVLKLKEQVAYQPGQVVSRTLAQNDALSVTLFSFDEDEEISTHASGGDAFVTCLDGVGRITIDGVPYELHEGDSIVMPAGHPHAVYGQEQFKMLLVVVF